MNVYPETQDKINAIDLLIEKLKNLIQTYNGSFAARDWGNSDAYCPIGTIFNTSSDSIAGEKLSQKSNCSEEEAEEIMNIFINEYDKQFEEYATIPASSDQAIDAVILGIKALDNERKYLKDEYRRGDLE